MLTTVPYWEALAFLGLLVLNGLVWVDWGSRDPDSFGRRADRNLSGCDGDGLRSVGHRGAVDGDVAGLASGRRRPAVGYNGGSGVPSGHAANGVLTVMDVFVEICRALFGVFGVIGCVGLLVGLIISVGGR